MGPDAIIAAAETLLREMPPAKVTRAAVARHAGVDPGLIRYYFKDRSSLLLAVLRRAVDGHRREYMTGHPSQSDATAAEQLRCHVVHFFQFNFAHPYIHRLLTEELAHSDQPEGRAYFNEINHGAVDFYSRLLKAGYKDGSLRKADPLLLHISLIGLCQFFGESNMLIEECSTKRDASPQTYAKRYAEMIANMVVDGLAPR